MAEFLNKLYSIPNFTTYLIIAIAVLVVVFLLILFLGKRDQKIEETKKLEKINVDGFKEVDEEPVKVEIPKESEKTEILITPVPPVNNEVKEELVFPEVSNQAVETPVIEDSKPEIPMPEVSFPVEETVKPVLEESEEPKIEEPSFTNIEIPEEPTVSEPIFEPTVEIPIIHKEEKKEIIVPKAPIQTEEVKIASEPKESMDKIPEIEIPDFNFDELSNSLNSEYQDNSEKKFAPNEVFSSVYVEKENTEDMEMPKLKEEKEEPKDNPTVLEPFTFDSINGETYNLK